MKTKNVTKFLFKGIHLILMHSVNIKHASFTTNNLYIECLFNQTLDSEHWLILVIFTRLNSRVWSHVTWRLNRHAGVSRLWMQIEGKWWRRHAVFQQYNWTIFVLFVHVCLFERAQLEKWCFVCILRVFWFGDVTPLLYTGDYSNVQWMDDSAFSFSVSLLKCFSRFPCLSIPWFDYKVRKMNQICILS